MSNLQQKLRQVELRSDQLRYEKSVIVSDNRVQAERFASLQAQHLDLLKQHEALQRTLARESGRLAAFLARN